MKIVLSDEELQANRELLAKAMEIPGLGYGVARNPVAVSLIMKLEQAINAQPAPPAAEKLDG